MKITDVKSIIKEIIIDEVNENNFRRDQFKVPSLGDQYKIQREFGFKINFENIVKTGEDTGLRWNRPVRPDGYGLHFYIVGWDTKDVNSTMDDDHAIMIAAMNYRFPFDKPTEYMAMAYGPKEMMKQVELTIKAQIYSLYPNDMGEGTDFTRIALKSVDAYQMMENIIHNNVITIATNARLKPEVKYQGKEQFIILPLPKNIRDIGLGATQDIYKELSTRFKNIGFRIDFRGDESNRGYYHLQLFNKYTGFTLANFNFFNVSLKPKDSRPNN